ncbi:Internal alternative NAD(P)H-ubiquinone oxidoreductase A1, mitochondrial [Datura stramonium]|uniref:Internal alternative NAD(P)H-ubiquinone oxidoreductase A1, mitochondrial n=1 Tax=Datura stramonium TaxID=4076 RepID=A0ABS8VEZ0_DATST|nr:Internal alternative NAD(P)H-ubiquinone oxidoreductase A1, mitochondrial [Datura stramonium]
MALVRAARSSLRRHRGAIGSYASERNIFCEGISPLRHPAPVLENAKTGFNSVKYIPSMRMINQLSFGNRGMKFTPQYQFPHAQVQMGEGSDSEHERSRYPSLEATKQGEKPRVVVLGSAGRLADTESTGKGSHSYFFLASCTGVDADKHEVYCETVGDRGVSHEPYRFKEEASYELDALRNSRHFIEEEKERLLHCVVIGGGPTGVEFSGSYDFIMRDVRQRYAHVKNYIHVTLIEANEILSSFDVGLREYATKHLTKKEVSSVFVEFVRELHTVGWCPPCSRRGVVKEVYPDKIVLSDGSDVPYGLLVWSTGVGPSEFVKSLNLPKSPGGRVGIDEWLRVPSVEDVFAIGDCAGFLEQTGKPVLPALAQVAERQGKHLGSMATVGLQGLVDLRQSMGEKGVSIAGFVSWFICVISDSE